MSNYSQQYRSYTQSDDAHRTAHYPQQQHHQTTTTYDLPSTLASAGPPVAYPSPTASYPMTYHSAQQPSMTYGAQPSYISTPSTYSGYPSSIGLPSGSYSYYENHAPSYSPVPGASQLPFPDYDPSIRHVLPPVSPPQYLQPAETAGIDQRASRSTSLASNASSMRYYPAGTFSRSASPSAQEMANWGYQNSQGTWSCAFPGCTSKSTFQRGCDLRKHYRRHSKTLFCRQAGCPQATQGGFSSKKDRARHEAKHNPQIKCEWSGCDRMFSRVDNMKDHVRRIHKRELAKARISPSITQRT